MPQMPCSQPMCVPVSLSRSRSASASVILGCASIVTWLPLTVICVTALWLAGHVLAAADEVRADVVRAVEVRADEVRADEVRADEVRADEVRDPPGEDRTPVGSRTGSALARRWALASSRAARCVKRRRYAVEACMSPGVSTSSAARADMGSVRARTRGWAGAPRVGSEEARAAVRWSVTFLTTGRAETPKAARTASCTSPDGAWVTRTATPVRA